MIISLIIIIFLIALDQVTKFLASSYLMGGTDVSFIKGFITFSYVENNGAAYGIFSNNQLILAIITFVALIGFGYLFTLTSYKNKKVFSLAVVFIISGTLGNALDRVTLGYVIDFLYYPFLERMLGSIGSFSNNFSDLYLPVGMILLAIHILFLEKPKKKEKDGNSNSTKS
ncbi:MAG: signal peptidase II [Acholeplasmatales bacterium]|jgi:signal peptidase II|nr:signal peptidase II [Acholeplasmatales bacterium]